MLLSLGLRCYELHDACFLWPDEYRSLGAVNIKVPWFSIIYSIPQKFFGSHQYVVLYTSALLGSLVVAIGTALTMSALGRKVTVLSGALLVCNGALVHFARSGYPVSLATLLMLLSALFMHLYLIASCSKRGWLYSVSYTHLTLPTISDV